MAHKTLAPKINHEKTGAAKRYKAIDKAKPGNGLVAMTDHLFREELALRQMSEHLGYRCGKPELLMHEEFRAAMYYAEKILHKDTRHPVKMTEKITTAMGEKITPLEFFERNAKPDFYATEFLQKKMAHLLPSSVPTKVLTASLHSQNGRDVTTSPYALEKCTPYQINAEGDVTLPEDVMKPMEPTVAPYAGQSMSFSRH